MWAVILYFIRDYRYHKRKAKEALAGIDRYGHSIYVEGNDLIIIR